MANWTSPTVYVIDPDPLVRRGLTELFSSVSLPAAYFARLDTCLTGLENNNRGCLLIDAGVDGCQPAKLLPHLAQREIHLPVIYLAQRPEIATAVNALKAGAFDFLEKPFHGQALLDSVQAALAVDQKTTTERQQHLVFLERFDKLTPREREVLPLLIRGLSNRQIAEQLSLSPKTVEVHRNRIIRKTGAENPARLIRMAIRIGLLDRPYHSD